MFLPTKLAVLTVLAAASVLFVANSANAAIANFQSTDGADFGWLDCSRLDYQNPRSNFVDVSIDANLWNIDAAYATALMDGCSQAQALEAAGNGSNYLVTLDFAGGDNASTDGGSGAVGSGTSVPDPTPTPSPTATLSPSPSPTPTPAPTATAAPVSTPAPSAAPVVSTASTVAKTSTITVASPQVLGAATLPKTGASDLSMLVSAAAASLVYLRMRRVK